MSPVPAVGSAILVGLSGFRAKGLRLLIGFSKGTQDTPCCGGTRFRFEGY